MLDSIGTSPSKTIRTPSLRPMGFTDILDGTFSLYRDHFKLFLSIAAVYHISTFGSDLLSTFVFDGFDSTNVLLIESVLNLFTSLVCGFTLCGLIYASMQTYLGQHVTPQGALRQVCYRFLPCFYSWLFVFVLIVALTVLISSSRSPNAVNVVLTVSVSLLAIYFIIRWFFYGMSVLFEVSTPKDALQRSTELVQGSWWRVFGIVTAVYFIALMMTSVLLASYFSILTLTGLIEEAPFWEMVLRLFSPRVSETGWLAYVIQRFIVRGIYNFTILPVWAIGPTLLYFDLRIRKDGFDLEMRARNIQNLM